MSEKSSFFNLELPLRIGTTRPPCFDVGGEQSYPGHTVIAPLPVRIALWQQVPWKRRVEGTIPE